MIFKNQVGLKKINHIFSHTKNKKALIIRALNFILVPRTGLEPVQPLRVTGF